MIYIEAKKLVDLAVQHHVLNTQDGGILVYRHAGSDPAKSPEGWYLEDPEDSTMKSWEIQKGRTLSSMRSRKRVSTLPKSIAKSSV